MRLSLSVFFLLLLGSLTAQDKDSLRPEKSFRWNYENDFFTATDYYFTQGVRFQFTFPALRKNPLTKIIPRLPQGIDEGFGFSINQLCFTPTSIREDQILYGDRPFAGALFLGFQRSSVDPEQQIRLSGELDLGGAGPCSECEQTQEKIHTWLKNIYPHGWQFQVHNGPVLNYHLKLEKGLFSSRFVRLNGEAAVHAGTLFSNAGLGLRGSLGRSNPWFAIARPTKQFRFEIFGHPAVNAVLYDASLQGPLFSTESPYTIAAKDLRRIVFRADAGLLLFYRSLRIEYSYTWISPEFEGGLKHAWGLGGIGLVF